MTANDDSLFLHSFLSLSRATSTMIKRLLLAEALSLSVSVCVSLYQSNI